MENKNGMSSLMDHSESQKAKLNAINRMKNIPTTSERDESRKPSVENFQRLWDSLISYNDAVADFEDQFKTFSGLLAPLLEDLKQLLCELILIFCPKVEMSRDVLTVGSTMRILLLYRGEYSQWVERFMNYLEEQTGGEAIINSIKNVETSRDVLTVGSTMRIPLLYRGEYSQWVEGFMNYLEEQTNGEAMINSIKN
nr:enzymatic polyprotein [Tanacetum cinerariifolium]